jgi:hypothetical protein
MRGRDTSEEKDPQPMYERGYYFDGDSQLQLSPNPFQADGYVLAQNFAFLAWFKGGGSLITLRPESTDKISISIDDGLLSVELAGQQIRASSLVHWRTVWSFCSVSVILGAYEQSYVELGCLNVPYERVPAKDAKCVEFLSTDGGLIGDGFVGFIAEFTLINEAVSRLEAYTQTSSTPQSFSSSLSECDYSQYLTEDSSCDDCSSECEEGCRDADDNCSQCDSACAGECFGFSTSKCCAKGQVYSKGSCITKHSSLTQQQRDEEDQRAQITSATSAANGSVLMGSFLAGSPDIFVGMFITIELISFLPLIDLDLTKHQEKLLTGSNQLSSLPEIIGGLECYAPSVQHSPYTISCANFLRSAQKEILVLAGLVILYGLLSFKRGSELIKQMLNALGPLIGKVLQSLVVDILVKACLFTGAVRVVSFQAVLSWILCVIFFLGLTVLAVKLFREAPNCESASPLFQHPELKPGRLPRLYYAFLILHRLIYAGAIVFLDSPGVQMAILAGSTFLVITRQLSFYLIIVRPYLSFGVQLQHFGGTFAVSCFFFSICLRETGALSESLFEEVITSGFMITMYSVLGVSVISMLWSIGAKAVEIYQETPPDVLEI